MYSPGSPFNIDVLLLEDGDPSPKVVELTRMPWSDRNGYLAGEPPGGTTTLNKKGVSAKVRVLLREDGPNDGCLVAEMVSGDSGEWLIEGVSPNRRYDIIGRLQGHNDGAVFDVSPIPTNRMYLEGRIEPNSQFNGMEGSLTIIGGYPPYTMQVSKHPPEGITIAIDRRDVLLIGTTAANSGTYSVEAEIFSGNGLSCEVKINVYIGSLKPPETGSASVAKLFKPTRFIASTEWAEGEPLGKSIEDIMKKPKNENARAVWDANLYAPEAFLFDIAKLFKPTRFGLNIIWKEQ